MCYNPNESSLQRTTIIKNITQHLRISDSPTCRPNQPKIYGVAKQERAQIKCQVDANPPDVHFRWTFNNSADSSDVAQTHITKMGTSSIVSYTPMTELDYGTLLCYASNKIGSQRVPCVFHIIAAGECKICHFKFQIISGGNKFWNDFHRKGVNEIKILCTINIKGVSGGKRDPRIKLR